jgi:Tol biopolymer transport system component
MNSDGTNIRKVIEESTEYQYVEPRWSPDDEKILFMQIGPELENWYLYIVNKDGSNMHRVINDNKISYCDWSK